jgi:hypothetical protein
MTKESDNRAAYEHSWKEKTCLHEIEELAGNGNGQAARRRGSGTREPSRGKTSIDH